MYCRHCGNEVKDGQKFCGKCGGQLPAALSKDSGDNLANSFKDEDGQDKKSPKEQSRRNIVVAIGACCVAVVVFAMLAAVVPLQISGNEQSSESQAGEAGTKAFANDAIGVALDDMGISVRNEQEAREVVAAAFARLDQANLGEQLGDCQVNEVFEATCYRFKQVVNGREVHGRTVILGVNSDGIADSLTSNAVNHQPIDQEAVISEVEASERLNGMFESIQAVSPADLVYYATSENEVELCYRFHIFLDSDVKYVFVSAISGALVGQIDKSFNEQVIGTGKTVDSKEEVPFTTEHNNDGTYSLEDRGRGITVYDAKHKKVSAYTAWTDASGRQYKYDADKSLLTALDDGTTKTLEDENWTYIGLYLSTPGVIGRLSVVTNNTTKWSNKKAVSAMYNVAKTHDFYQTVLKRNGFSDNDAHNTGVCINTKDGTNSAFGITGEDAVIRLNESDDMQFDVTAHEFTHNVEQSISGMNYEGESGALMEATSDVFAELAQDFSDDGNMNNSCDWKLSGRRDLAVPEKSLIAERSSGENKKAHPSLYPSKERESKYWADTTPQYKKRKDGKQGKTTNDRGHVHNNSTVVSHAAYLMCNGDLDGDALETEELAKLLYSVFYYIPSNCDFSLYAGWVNRKAAEMLPPRKAQRVEAAFEAVGIDAAFIVYIDGNEVDGNAHEAAGAIPESSNDARYAEYLKKVRELEAAYGKAAKRQVGQAAGGLTGGKYTQLEGLCLVRLVDFDNNGTEELLTVVKDQGYDTSNPYPPYGDIEQPQYKADVWSYENGSAVNKLEYWCGPGGFQWLAIYEWADRVMAGVKSCSARENVETYVLERFDGSIFSAAFTQKTKGAYYSLHQEYFIDDESIGVVDVTDGKDMDAADRDTLSAYNSKIADYVKDAKVTIPLLRVVNYSDLVNRFDDLNATSLDVQDQDTVLKLTKETIIKLGGDEGDGNARNAESGEDARSIEGADEPESAANDSAPSTADSSASDSSVDSVAGSSDDSAASSSNRDRGVSEVEDDAATENASTDDGPATGSFHGHTYELFDEHLTWTEAEQYCESIGGHLVVIETPEEQEYLNGLLGESNNMVWIGLQRSDSGWQWVTGEPLGFANWATGEPNEDFGGTELCCQMYVRGHEYTSKTFLPGEWNDSRDDGGTVEFWRLNNTGFICEWE